MHPGEHSTPDAAHGKTLDSWVGLSARLLTKVTPDVRLENLSKA